MTQVRTATPLAQVSGGLGTTALVSLATGPLIMAIGGLIHPPESSDIDRQVDIVAANADRWYLAHLLLFVGFVLFIPGLIALTGLVAARWPRSGAIARVLTLTGVAGTSAIFVAEMVAGRLGTAHLESTKDLFETLFSPQVAIPVFTVALGFFVGPIVLALRMISGSPRLRWPALILLAGLLSIVAELLSSQVVLSQAGSVLVWVGSVGLAWALRGKLPPAPTETVDGR